MLKKKNSSATNFQYKSATLRSIICLEEFETNTYTKYNYKLVVSQDEDKLHERKENKSYVQANTIIIKTYRCSTQVIALQAGEEGIF
jgi:hypothetical protein